MAHMWVGKGNPEGPFNATHATVSPDAVDEASTFVDGSGGHHHHHHHNHGGTLAAPESEAVTGALPSAQPAA